MISYLKSKGGPDPLNDRYHGKIPKDKLYKWRLGKHNFIEDNDVVEWRFDIDI